MSTFVARRPLLAVEVSLRRLRLLGVVALVGVMLFWRDASDVGHSGLVALGLVLALLIGNWASVRMSSAGSKVDRLVWVQLVVDVVASVGVIAMFAPEDGSVIWVVVGLPVLEGALRFRVVGAVGAWLSIAVLVVLRSVLIGDQGDGFVSAFELLSPLSLGLLLGIPAGYLAENLTAELLIVSDNGLDSERRSRLLAVLTVAGQDLSTHMGKDEPLLIGLDAALELGYSSAEVGTIDVDQKTWRVLHSRAGEGAEVLARWPEALEVEATRAGGGSALHDDRISIGVLDSDGAKAVLLRAYHQGIEAWEPREEAFAMLVANVALSAKSATDLRDLKLAQDKLQFDASHDVLTGLLNRAGLVEALDMKLLANRGLAPNCPTTSSPAPQGVFAVFFMDLDGFKAVNDQYGHAAGDLVLAEVANRLKYAAPDGSSIGRIGGDEFVVVADLADGASVYLVHRVLSEAIASPIDIGVQVVRVGVSIGSAMVDEPSVTSEQVLRSADARMYVQKMQRAQPDLSRSGRSVPADI